MGVISCGTTMLDEGLFQNLPVLSWDTTVKTANFTAVSGNGYFVNSTAAARTVTLPSSPSAGNIVGIKDYANTGESNSITIARNGSNINGSAEDVSITNEGGSITLFYIDATQGWTVINSGQKNDVEPPTFVAATGGTISTSGDYKIHTFTGPGTFTVTDAGNAGGSNTVDYMVVGGGAGGGGGQGGGGGGAGGFRESCGCGYTSSPKGSGVASIPVAVTGYPVSIGGGGAGVPGPSCGNNGGSSAALGITSAGGGGGGSGGGNPQNEPGVAGGSGGGGGGRSGNTGGAGNTPSVSPPQGNTGGSAPPKSSPTIDHGVGGGGATAVGSDGPNCGGGPGGAGATTNIPGSSLSKAGGGGGGSESNNNGSGGPGGGAAGGVDASANTGGGGGGNAGADEGEGKSGGSGIVVIRYKFQ